MRELIEELGEALEAGEWAEEDGEHYHSSGKVRILVHLEGTHEVQMRDGEGWATVESRRSLSDAKSAGRTRLNGG